jgi:glycosyltransferase involved in cell wall biosynthesis
MYGGNKYEMDIAKCLDAFSVSVYNIFRPSGDQLCISLLQLIRSVFRFDLVITNLTGNIFASIFLFWKPRCILIHHIDWRGSPRVSRWLQQLEYAVLRYLTPRHTSIVVVSKVWARHLARLGFKDVTIIYNAFDIDKYQVSPEEKARVLQRYELQGQRLAYVGNGLKRKGVHLATAALADAGVRIISTGVQSDAPSNASLAVLNLPFDDYIALLSCCEVAVLLSQFREGWNRTAHEAVLLGVPVIGAPRGGMRELLRLTGQALASTTGQAREKYLGDRYGIEASQVRLARQFPQARFNQAWQELVARLVR